jgi:hypothetical protein
LAPRSHGGAFAGLGFLIAPLLSCKQFYIQVAGVFLWFHFYFYF